MLFKKKNKLSTIFICLLSILTFSSASAQEIECFDSGKDKVCRTGWVETHKTNSKVLQVRFAYLNNIDTYYMIFGHLSLKGSWHDIKNIRLTINERSHTIKSIDQDTREAGDGIFEFQTLNFNKSYLEKIIKADYAKFKIGEEQFIISKEMRSLVNDLFGRVSKLKSNN